MGRKAWFGAIIGLQEAFCHLINEGGLQISIINKRMNTNTFYIVSYSIPLIKKKNVHCEWTSLALCHCHDVQ